jgi:ketosteroid isomerase-like protein
MSGEDNKNVVRRFFKALEAGDLEQADHLTTDDFTFWVTPTTIRTGTYTKDKLLWLRHGKISAVKEYLDTYHVGEIFGFPNSTYANESSLRFAAK